MNMKTVVAPTIMVDISSNCQTRLLSSITAITAQLPDSFSTPNTLLKIYSSFVLMISTTLFPVIWCIWACQLKRMAGLRRQLRALQNDPNLGQFILRDVRPTGRQLGVGSYGSVEEVLN